MAAIALPTCPVPNEASPFLVDAGGDLVPFLPGGVVQRINRAGSRMGVRYSMPEMDEDEGRTFVTRLMRGKSSSVLMPYPLFNFDPGTPPNPQINAASTGTALSIKGLGANYEIRESQPLSVIHGGVRYLHFSTGEVVANGSGIASVGIWPPARVTFSVNDTVEITEPMIEGRVSPGDEISWQIALDNGWSVPFSVVERR